MHPHVGPQYVRGARRNGIDGHWGEVARLGMRNSYQHGVLRERVGELVLLQHLRTRQKEKGDTFRVGLFLDFVRRSGTTRTMHPHVGPQYVRGAKRNRIGPHWGGVERLMRRTIDFFRTLMAKMSPVAFCLASMTCARKRRVNIKASRAIERHCTSGARAGLGQHGLRTKAVKTMPRQVVH